MLMTSPSLITPLARKLAATHQVTLDSLTGTGPRGRVMATDVRSHLQKKISDSQGQTPHFLDKTSVAADQLPQTRPEKGGYYIYDCSVDMFALASLSRPIAVQCDRLLDKRYSLMDYILRAVIKACTGHHSPSEESLDVLLFENSGEYICALRDVAAKTLYQLAHLVQRGGDSLDDFSPQIIVCDAQTTREQVHKCVKTDSLPLFGFVTRGETQKVGIRVGCEVSSMVLTYTFYISNQIAAHQADNIAARLRNLLYDPVSLLLID